MFPAGVESGVQFEEDGGGVGWKGGPRKGHKGKEEIEVGHSIRGQEAWL